jgi:hypothetical protein
MVVAARNILSPAADGAVSAIGGAGVIACGTFFGGYGCVEGLETICPYAPRIQTIELRCRKYM